MRVPMALVIALVRGLGSSSALLSVAGVHSSIDRRSPVPAHSVPSLCWQMHSHYQEVALHAGWSQGILCQHGIAGSCYKQ